MILRWTALAVTALVAVTAGERAAHACSPPQCGAAMTMPGGAMPAGVKAIPFLPSSGNGGGAGQVFRILTAAGIEVATATASDAWQGGNAKLLVPSVALAAGSYQLAYEETCGAPTDVKTAFTVGSAVAPPTSAGSVDATNRVVGKLNVGTASGSCTVDIEAVSFDIVVKPSPGLLAYRNVAAFKVEVDGKPGPGTTYGRATEKDGALVVTKLHAACGDRKGSDSNGPELGTHTVTVKAHVAGETTDPPAVSVAVNFSCTDDSKPPPIVDDGGAVPITPPTGGGTSSSSSGATPNAAAPSDESGCAMTPRAGSAGLAAWALAALAVVARRRRR